MTEEEKDFVYKLFLYITIYNDKNLYNKLQEYCLYLLRELEKENYDGYRGVARELDKNGFTKKDMEKIKKIIKNFGDLSSLTSTEVSDFSNSDFSLSSIENRGCMNLSTLTEVSSKLSDCFFLSTIESKPLNKNKNKNKKTNHKGKGYNPNKNPISIDNECFFERNEHDSNDFLFRLFLYIKETNRDKELLDYPQRLIKQLKNVGYNRYREVYEEVERNGFNEEEIRYFEEVIENIQNINENIAIPFDFTVNRNDGLSFFQR